VCRWRDFHWAKYELYAIQQETCRILNECDWLVMTSVFVASQSRCFLLGPFWRQMVSF
jgi:hypothetical protein